MTYHYMYMCVAASILLLPWIEGVGMGGDEVEDEDEGGEEG